MCSAALNVLSFEVLFIKVERFILIFGVDDTVRGII
jgi:hypothetical protein